MSLSFDTQDGGAQGIVGPTVFAVGQNEKYIVVKQHPAKDEFASSFDRNVTNFFVVERVSSLNLSDPTVGLHGPMNEGEYKQFEANHKLPPFEKVFTDLE